MKQHSIVRAILYSSTMLASMAANAKSDISFHENESKQADFRYTEASLSALNLSSVSIVSDDQFVFNNQLAALDWDSAFESYMPALREHKSTIMHYAGHYSINPKILIVIMDMKSHILSNPSKESFDKPFGDLSKKRGFREQIQDVASQLSKRFYAFRRIEIDKQSPDKYLLKHIVPTSAATVALSGLLSDRRALKDVESFNALSNFLTTYEDIFVESKSHLLKQQNFSKQREESDIGKDLTINETAQLATPSLYLPWASGWSWRSGGAHGYDGSSWPLSSLDVYYPYGNSGWGGNKPPVYASHGGTVTWFSRCQMRITHSSGIATNYYHMDNLQYSSGSYVNAGTYIGRYANNKSVALCEGGSSTGPHLHISLMRNGYWESLQGYNFNGYYVQVGSYQYDSNCNRSYLWKNGRTYCHGTDIYKPY